MGLKAKVKLVICHLFGIQERRRQRIYVTGLSILESNHDHVGMHALHETRMCKFILNPANLTKFLRYGSHLLITKARSSSPIDEVSLTGKLFSRT